MSVNSSHAPTYQQADGAVHLPFEKHYPFTFADIDPTNSNVLFPIPAGCIVLAVGLLITTAFNGTSQDVDEVGDSTDPNGWLEDAELTAGTGYTGSQNGAAAYALKSGKYYSDANYVEVQFAAHDGTTGVGELIIFFSGKETGDNA